LRVFERADLLAELDAAYFYLYGLFRDDVEYTLTIFQAHRPDALSSTGQASA
jgi:hypothetical protein